MKSMAAVVTSAEEALRPGVFAGMAGPVDASTSPPKLPPPEDNDLEPTIYRFILKYSLRPQVLLLLFTLASFPFLYYSLNLPKTIINHAIREDATFPQSVLGIDFDRIPYLMWLCALFLLLVFVNGAFKYYINTFKGQMGERMLRRFRYQLYQRLLRFPLSYFEKTSSAQIIPMITVECEQLGGFIGDAFAQPAFQGGQLLVMILFIIWE